MGNNKYVKIHSLVRMFAALLAIAVFISMFIAKQIIHADNEKLFFTWTEAFFGGNGFNATVFGFIGYLLVFIGGLAGLAFVFIDEIIGKDLTKKLSFVVGGVMVLGGIAILLFTPVFKALNDIDSDLFKNAAGPIVFGIFALVAGACNVAAPILEDKGL